MSQDSSKNSRQSHGKRNSIFKREELLPLPLTRYRSGSNYATISRYVTYATMLGHFRQPQPLREHSWLANGSAVYELSVLLRPVCIRVPSSTQRQKYLTQFSIFRLHQTTACFFTCHFSLVSISCFGKFPEPEAPFAYHSKIFRICFTSA